MFLALRIALHPRKPVIMPVMLYIAVRREIAYNRHLVHTYRELYVSYLHTF